jgi:hypothetical protein
MSYYINISRMRLIGSNLWRSIGYSDWQFSRLSSFLPEMVMKRTASVSFTSILVHCRPTYHLSPHSTLHHVRKYTFFFHWLYSPFGPCLLLFSFMIILQMVGLLGWVISPSQGLYLNTGQHKHIINAYTHQTSMPRVGLEPTIPASEREKTVHALDRAATVTSARRTLLPDKYIEAHHFTKFYVFYETRSFIATFITIHNWTLFWNRWI